MSPEQTTSFSMPAETAEDLDRLVQAVNPQVRELLGEETIWGIEFDSYYMEWLDRLQKMRDPFADRTTSKSTDLSFLPPESAEKAEEILAGHLRVAKGLSSPIMRQAVEVSEIAYDIHSHCVSMLDAVGNAVKDVKKDIMDQIMSKFGQNDYQFDINAVEAAIGALKDQGNLLPTQATVQIPEILYKKALALQTTAANRNPFGAAKKLVGIQSKITKRNIERAQGLKGYNTTTVRLGSATFALLKPAIKYEEILAAADLLLKAEGAKERLAAGRELTDVSTISLAERYLTQRARLARTVIAGADPSALKIPEVQKALSNLSSQNLAEMITDEKRAEKLEEAKEFSIQLTEARDIALGGQRLKPNKALQQPAEIAKRLDSILSNGEREIAQRGLIISILSDRFPGLLHTIDRLNDENKDSVVTTMEIERPDVILRLQEFSSNLPGYMERIREHLLIDTDSLIAVIGESGVQKVQEAVDNYFAPDEIQNNADEIGTPNSIESALPYAELINRLDWTVLPKGEHELEDAARAIVGLAQERTVRGAKIEIDLERLTILRNVRVAWDNLHRDKSHHFYARGTLKGRGFVSTEEGDCPDEYIILVLQKKDEYGRVVMEHALAESPIARVNALYVLRSDISPGSWEEIFSLSKKEARELGARGLHHTKGDGRPVADVLTDRANLLLTCPPENFFLIRFDGPRTWLRKRVGKTAIG